METEARDREELYALLDESTSMEEKGFSIDLQTREREWNRCIDRLGTRQSYRLMAERLCEEYRERYGREFLFSVPCVAYEIRFHANAFLWAKGYPGYLRNVSTWLFSRAKLILHCKEVDISTDDVQSLRQRLMFRYRRGVRTCYRGGDADPFDRRGLLHRLSGPRRKTPETGEKS